MFTAFASFTKHMINQRPFTVVAITSAGGFIGGCGVTSYYMRSLIKNLENQLANQTAKVSPDNSVKGKIKRGVNVVTDETVDYVTRGWENNFFFKTWEKVRGTVESKNDTAEADPKKQEKFEKPGKIRK